MAIFVVLDEHGNPTTEQKVIADNSFLISIYKAQDTKYAELIDGEIVKTVKNQSEEHSATHKKTKSSDAVAFPGDSLV